MIHGLMSSGGQSKSKSISPHKPDFVIYQITTIFNIFVIRKFIREVSIQ